MTQCLKGNFKDDFLLNRIIVKLNQLDEPIKYHQIRKKYNLEIFSNNPNS